MPVILTYHTRLEMYSNNLPIFKLFFKNILSHKMIRNFAQRCDAIIAPTVSAKEYLSNVGVSRPKLVLPTGIDFASYESAEDDFITSKIIVHGYNDVLNDDNKEKVVILFWHGDSYCLYPALIGTKLYIVTTKDRRGDYISEMCKYFGYQTIRVPDVSDGGNYLFNIGKIINKEDVSNIAISMDGPLGPYHVPKDFALVSALLTKRKVLPISINVKRKIELKRRWDNYKIPLPFNRITITFNQPIEVTKEDKKEGFVSIKNKIRVVMESTRIKT